MPFVIQSRPDPTLEYDVTDAASQSPARVTVLTGVVGFAYDWQGKWRVSSKGPDNREPMGFFVPGAPALPPSGVIIVPEMFLSQVGVYDGDIKATKIHGCGEVKAELRADPERGGQPNVFLSFVAIGTEPMGLRYRVTLYRPRP
jgi:hypothetical protein